MEDFARNNEAYLRRYIELKNGIPSHDTIQRAMGVIRSEQLQQLQMKWQELLNTNEGEKLKKIICIDGKTMRGNKRGEQKPNHIVSAWSREYGFCLGQKAVKEKSNEIVAIPEVLEGIEIKSHVVTIDAMGTQTAIAEKIRKRRADYVLALKENQGTLYGDVKLYLMDEEEKAKIRESGNYRKRVEKAHGQLEIREYYQTEEIVWLEQKKKWNGLKSIGMEEKTIRKGDKEEKEYRYYISSLKADIELFSRAVRGHWAVESMHWQLDVTFHEDTNTTLDRVAAQNQNIIRKWCLSILKMIEIRGKKIVTEKKIQHKHESNEVSGRAVGKLKNMNSKIGAGKRFMRMSCYDHSAILSPRKTGASAHGDREDTADVFAANLVQSLRSGHRGCDLRQLCHA